MGTILVCHFSTHGWLPPLWETGSGVNSWALCSLSVTLSCWGNSQFLPTRAWLLHCWESSAACPEWGLNLATLQSFISASIHSCPFIAGKETNSFPWTKPRFTATHLWLGSKALVLFQGFCAVHTGSCSVHCFQVLFFTCQAQSNPVQSFGDDMQRIKNKDREFYQDKEP